MNLDKIEPGQTGTLESEVTEDLAINRMGKPGAEVLSTPSLVMLMERCAIATTDHLLPDGATTVGYAFDKMRHIAPTAIGGIVTLHGELTQVDGSKLTYSIEANKGEKQIGSTVHKRAVIPIA